MRSRQETITNNIISNGLLVKFTSGKRKTLSPNDSPERNSSNLYSIIKKSLLWSSGEVLNKYNFAC